MNWLASGGLAVLCAVPWCLWRGCRTGEWFWFVLADVVTLAGCVLLHGGLGAQPGPVQQLQLPLILLTGAGPPVSAGAGVWWGSPGPARGVRRRGRQAARRLAGAPRQRAPPAGPAFAQGPAWRGSLTFPRQLRHYRCCNFR